MQQNKSQYFEGTSIIDSIKEKGHQVDYILKGIQMKAKFTSAVIIMVINVSNSHLCMNGLCYSIIATLSTKPINY